MKHELSPRPIFTAIVGAIGLALDLSFHWVSAGFEGSEDGSWNPVSTLGFLQTLLIDVDPATVPLWATLLGVAAHVMFLGGFTLLVVMALKDRLPFRRMAQRLWGTRSRRDGISGRADPRIEELREYIAFSRDVEDRTVGMVVMNLSQAERMRLAKSIARLWNARKDEIAPDYGTIVASAARKLRDTIDQHMALKLAFTREEAHVLLMAM